MNWKIVVGILLILGSIKECFSLVTDYQQGITHFNPIYGLLGCAMLMGLGIYLVKKGRQKKPLK